MKCPVKSSSL